MPARYVVERAIGRGAYGLVAAARDTVTGERVAIKRVAGAFESVMDARRTLREIRLLRALRHENVVALRDAFPPPPRPGGRAAAFNTVYVVFDAADTDLHQLIRSPQPLPPEHARFLTYQILRALKFLHSAGVVHRDLKPSNVLVDAGGGARLCDFGLARAGAGVGANAAAEGGTFPEYVVTRWYRAPELLLACGGAAAAAPPLDLWSAGCVLGELLGRKPLFPGRDAAHTLALVLAVTGSPGAAEAAAALAAAPRPPADLARLFPAAPPAARDLLCALLALEPAARPTAAQALAHPWFAGLSDPDDEPSAAAPLPADPEIDAMGAAAVRVAVFAEMCTANPALLRA